MNNIKMPSSPEIEKALLNEIVYDPTNENLTKVKDLLSLAHFHNPDHKAIYGIILKLYSENEPYIKPIIKGYIEKHQIEIGTDLSFLDSSKLPSLRTENQIKEQIDIYIKELLEQKQKRDLLGFAEKIYKSAASPDVKPIEIKENLEQDLQNIFKCQSLQEEASLKSLVLADADKLTMPRIKLDALLNDIEIQPASLNLIVGRSGHGKSTFTYNLLHWLLERKEKCLYISYEIPAGLLYARYWQVKHNDPRPVKDVLLEVAKNTEHHYTDDLKILYGQRYRIKDIQRIAIRYKPKVLFIDHVAKVYADEEMQRMPSEERRLAVTTEALTELARTYGICIFLVVQTNREQIRKDKNPLDKYPKVEHVRGSDAIFHEADTAIGVFAPFKVLDEDQFTKLAETDAVSFADTEPLLLYCLKSRWFEHFAPLHLSVNWQSGRIAKADDTTDKQIRAIENLTDKPKKKGNRKKKSNNDSFLEEGDREI